jgi:Anti-sigma factor NepR
LVQPGRSGAGGMFDRDGLLPEDEIAWLLTIGRRLRAEYAVLDEPVPERLAALVAQLEKQDQRQSAEPLDSSADEAPPPEVG